MAIVAAQFEQMLVFLLYTGCLKKVKFQKPKLKNIALNSCNEKLVRDERNRRSHTVLVGSCE